jgi:hypothetical protein
VIARLKARLRCWLRGTHVMAVTHYTPLGWPPSMPPRSLDLGFCRACGKELA